MATDYGRKPDSIGQPESMRNEEQKLRDNQGGSELTDRPDDHPVGAPGETASAEAEGPPPALSERDDRSRVEGPALSERDDRSRVEGPALSERDDRSRVEGPADHETIGDYPDPDETRGRGPLHPGDNEDIGAPVRSMGPTETTLPEESPLTGKFQPGPPEQDQGRGTTREDVSRAEQKLRDTRVEPGGKVVPPEERGE